MVQVDAPASSAVLPVLGTFCVFVVAPADGSSQSHPLDLAFAPVVGNVSHVHAHGSPVLSIIGPLTC